MKNSILSATFSFAIFLNAAATFAGQWTEVPGGAATHPSTLDGVAVVSADDVWAVGSWGQGGARALIEHWDGTNWSVAAVLSPGTLLLGVAAHSARDVWAVGQNLAQQTLVEHWNGQRWAIVPSPNVGTYAILSAVCAISHNDAWAVGYSSSPSGPSYILMHWDGTSWSLVNAATLADAAGLGSLKAFASDDVWAVGSKDGGNGFTGSTFTLHWDGTAWSEIPSPNVDEFSGLVGVDGASPNDVWAVGTSCGVNGCNYLALHWDGAVWTVVPTPVQNNTSEFHALAAVSSTNVVAVGRSDFIPSSARWDGKQWNVVPTPPLMNTFGYLLSVSGRNGSLWAVGYQDFKEIQEDDLIFKWTR